MCILSGVQSRARCGIQCSRACGGALCTLLVLVLTTRLALPQAKKRSEALPPTAQVRLPVNTAKMCAAQIERTDNTCIDLLYLPLCSPMEERKQNDNVREENPRIKFTRSICNRTMAAQSQSNSQTQTHQHCVGNYRICSMLPAHPTSLLCWKHSRNRGFIVCTICGDYIRRETERVHPFALINKNMKKMYRSISARNEKCLNCRV